MMAFSRSNLFMAGMAHTSVGRSVFCGPICVSMWPGFDIAGDAPDIFIGARGYWGRSVRTSGPNRDGDWIDVGTITLKRREGFYMDLK